MVLNRRFVLGFALSALAYLAIVRQPINGQDLASLLEQAEKAASAAGESEIRDFPRSRTEPPQPRDPSRPTGEFKEKRNAAPSASDAANAIARVKQVFAARYSGPLRPSGKAKLAQEMLALLASTSETPDRWALLTEATRLACEAGDVGLATSAAQKLCGEFNVESADLMYAAMKQLAASVTLTEIPRLASECMAAARSAIDQGDFVMANKAIALARSLARKIRDRDLVAEANRLSSIVKNRERVDERLSLAIEQLRASPADPDLNTQVGLALCLVKSRWGDGLPFLMKSGNPLLTKIAKMEQEGPANTQQAVALGDAWWSWAESEKGPFGDAGRQRAMVFYNQAVVGLEGLERAVLEKRIAAISASGAGTGQAVALADLQELETADVYSGVTKNGTFNGQSYTCGGLEYSKGIYTPPKAQSTAMIAYRAPPGARRLKGGAGVFSLAGKDNQPASAMTMEIAVDGEVVWRSPAFTAREQAARFDVPLNNATRVELRTRAAGSNASCWGAWLDPVFVK